MKEDIWEAHDFFFGGGVDTVGRDVFVGAVFYVHLKSKASAYFQS